MKKILFYLIACILSLSACETESDEWENIDYTIPSVSFLNVSGKDYQVLFNGTAISYVPLDNSTGELTVYEKAENTLKLDTTITIVSGQAIQLLLLLNQSLIIYNEDNEKDYSYFSVNIPYTSDKDNTYQILYNGQKVAIGKNDSGLNFKKNFIPASELTGTLQVYKNNETSPVLDQEITIDPGQMINLVQLPNEEIRIDLSEEEDPANRNSIKVRFLNNNKYMIVDYLRIDVFVTASSNNKNYAQYDSITSIVAKYNEFSPYVELDLARFYNNSTITDPRLYIAYKLYNEETGERLLPAPTSSPYYGNNSYIYETLLEPNDRGPLSLYKFLTWKFNKYSASSKNYGLLFVYGTEWGTTE